MATYQELLKQQAALSVQIEEARKREIADAVSRARQIVAEYGLTEKDVFPAGRRSPVTRATSKVAPKYRDPATGQTWTGRGKPPKWIEGRDRLGFLIA
ncbi:MAG TPA: H-NS histone family protein [Ottowia sp.]|nr:H-NS histone family protein [Ottowia sp.]HRB09281.1 H-NS histone family protein [Ottowia sp.]